MGMVSILGSMEEDPGGLGSKIATAFIATMYGVASANVLWLPFAARIKSKAEREKMVNDLIIEGLLSVQAGESSRIIKEKLNLSLMESMSGKSNTSNAKAVEE
jgi:chemotaxis protein MotA